jgi:hypothetical protein
LDEDGKPIPFKFGEKIAKASLFWKVINPEEITEGSLDVTIPRMALKEKALGKIEIPGKDRNQPGLHPLSS